MVLTALINEYHKQLRRIYKKLNKNVRIFYSVSDNLHILGKFIYILTEMWSNKGYSDMQKKTQINKNYKKY